MQIAFNKNKHKKTAFLQNSHLYTKTPCDYYYKKNAERKNAETKLERKFPVLIWNTQKRDKIQYLKWIYTLVNSI